MSSEPAEKKSKMPLTLGYWKIRGVSIMTSFKLVISCLSQCTAWSAYSTAPQVQWTGV